MITADQTATGANPNGVTSQVITWATLPAAGAKALVLIGSTVSVSSVKDNGAVQSTFTQDVLNTGGGSFLGVWRADGISLPGAGSYSVTVTFSAAALGVVGGRTYRGAAVGGPASSNNTASGTSGSVATGSLTPPAAGALLFGGFIDDSGVNPETITLTTSGATPVYSTGNGNVLCGAAADHVTSTGAAQGLAWTLSDTPNWGTVIAAYAAAAVSPGGLLMAGIV
jgi:hypothetical protein